ncbi:MAG: hypothetical protein QXX64_04560 [Nitrososphaera sp.]
MPRSTQIKAAELASRLAALDVDEGIRIEKKNNDNAGDEKIFVNRNASGMFIVQHGSDFQYLESARQVVSVIKSRFGSKKYTIWAY